MQNTAYGIYRNGQILLDTLVPALEESRVRVIFLNEENEGNEGNNLNDAVVPGKTVAQRQHEAFERFFAAIDSIDDEPITDDDLNNFANNRVNFIRELDL